MQRFRHHPCGKVILSWAGIQTAHYRPCIPENGEKTQTVEGRVGATLNVKQPVRKGYTFTGWTPEFPEKIPNEDVTYQAQWRKNSYLVQFVSEGTVLKEYTLSYGMRSRLRRNRPEKDIRS